MTSSSHSERSPSASPRIFSEVPTPDSETDGFDTLTPVSDGEDYVLVTGGLGFIGSHTCLELMKAGYNVLIVDDLSNSYRHVFSRILLAAKLHFDSTDGHCPKATLYDVDYRDKSAMRNLLDAYQLDLSTRQSSIIGVIHFAAFKQVEESIHIPLKYYRNNINGLVDLLVLLDQYRITTFIFSSSANVYGKLAENRPILHEEECIHQAEPNQLGASHSCETNISQITNPYGRTKLFGEAVLADVARANPAWTIVALRYFNPIGCDASGLLGEDPKINPSNLVPAVVDILTGKRDELLIYGNDWDTPDGTPIRDFIHVTDVARGHTAALAAAREGRVRDGFRTFNLGTGRGHSVLELVQTLEKVSGRMIPRRVVGRRAGDVGSCVASAERAAVELGWTTQKSLRDACEDLWSYLQQ
ncbi:UDP-glucose 4-epimerase [Aspergillus lentulus]|uniref:UDP-glucose 4-epimerase n=1 Tax=Aspergillus lentulus TaxID=293939 RepID=A0ABQ1A9Y0_ASPLE|nr:UDP-glucose 4-epimerase [Aspergillus lentulus]GFF76985.1 UDP-glucose 4-epimerase [Aspergillus lentulus]GFF80483.1 UDP-glucose 4-epimerase [Aspergillus lentulus]GFG08577.1 UDP-glucose 4-epimerase [Aspergillus lentulus]